MLDLGSRYVGRLLYGMFWSGIFRIDRFASGKTFILTMVETNAVFSKPPAQIHLFVPENGGKIHQAGFEVFHHAAGGMNPIERILNLRNQAIVIPLAGAQRFRKGS